MKKLKPETIKLLRKVKQHILQDPRRFDMRYWAKHRRGPACGTTGCIAGWATLLTTLPRRRLGLEDLRHVTVGFDAKYSEGGILTTEGTGQRVLNLTKRQADKLFYVTWWPAKFKDGFHTLLRTEQARIAANRIEHFIRTNGAE